MKTSNPPPDQDQAAPPIEAADRKEAKVPWYRLLGPGVITGAADDDPSGIGTYSATGAQFGYLLLWLVPVCLPLMIAVQEMCGRIGIIQGKGLAAVIRRNYPRWLLLGCVAMLITANTFNVFADLNVMGACCKMLFGTPMWLALTVIAVAIAMAQILIPYRLYAKGLKWLCISLAGYVIVALLPGVHNDWPEIARGLVVPYADLKPDTVLAIVAFLGTTISPYLFFWQASETVEEELEAGNIEPDGTRINRASKAEVRRVRADTAIGMVVSQAIAFFVVVATAGTLHRSGVTSINTAEDAARALLPLGSTAYWLFSICMIGTGLLAIPTMAGSAAYAIAETRGWKWGLYRRFGRAKGFYLTIVGVIFAGYLLNFTNALSPVKALVYSAALNGVVAPPLIVVLLLICNNRRIVGDRTNGLWSNVFGWLTVALMGPAAIYLVYAVCRGLA